MRIKSIDTEDFANNERGNAPFIGLVIDSNNTAYRHI